MKTKVKIVEMAGAFCILFCISCSEDFLEQKPSSTITELTYFKNVAELETGLVACYGALQSSSFGRDHWIIGDIGSDDAEKGGKDVNDWNELTEISYSQPNASNLFFKYVWNSFYAIIAKCNKLIEKSAQVQGEAEAIEKITNQAKFIRALCFYHLVTAFGDVPLTNRFLNPDELDLNRAPASEVWKQIESDLTDATNLPGVTEWNQYGRITSGAAYSLLGKVYLTQEKFSEANSAFSRVVQSGEYQLVADYGLIYRKQGENSAESVFEIQHKTTIHNGYYGTFWGENWRMPRDKGAGGWGFDCPTVELLHEFEPGDPRTIYTFMFPGDVFPMTGGTTYTVVNESSPTGYISRKAWIPYSDRTGLSWWNWDTNYRYMRYAEVLLLYAESLNEVNKPDSAKILLNMVRARARNTPATDPQRISCAYPLSYSGELLPDVTTTNYFDLRDAIWHEQRVELAIEGHRRNILLRTERFKDRMEAAKGANGCSVDPHELLFPIPQIEIELSNNLLTQNPGY